MKTIQNFKTGLTLFVLAICFMLSGMQCEKTFPPGTAEIDKLPSKTQIGANTFGCLVDGKALIPRKKGWAPGGSILQCSYQYTVNNGHLGYFLALSASDETSFGDGTHVIQLTSDSLELKEQSYVLDEDDTINKLSGKFVIISDAFIYQYKTNQVQKGELIITKFDDVNQIMSGTFWFDAVNDKGVKVEVRDGRFDVHFIK
jgi:hypothetical protein